MEGLIYFLLSWLGPILAGSGLWWLSNKVRGRNGQKALRFTAMGFWTLLLPRLLPFLIPGFGWLLYPLAFLLPIGFFLAAANSIIKEMRAQQRGDNTERAL